MARSAEDIATALSARHGRREQFATIFEDGETPDLPFAYAVQDRYVAGLLKTGAKAGGYKIGLTTLRMQKMVNINEPICGVILDSRIHRSPASLAAADFVRLGVESEIAVRVGAGISNVAAGGPLPRLESIVDEVCAAFEVIEDSAADYRKLSAAGIVADNCWNGGLVLGPTVSARGLGSLADRQGVLNRDGKLLDQGSSNDVLGNPLNVVVWLAEHLRQRGRRLEPGQWVSTGSIVPTVFVKAGERYSFTVAGLPPVELEIK